MPKIIVSSRYTRNSPKRNAANLVEYMGTREGVEKVPAGRDKSPSTRQQFNLILDLAMKYKEANEYPELETYLNELTVDAANEFLDAFAERHADQLPDMKKLVSYMAQRPGVEKLGTHGLFSQTDDKIDLEKVSEEVGRHSGIIWTHVVSLRREDAERLGYNNAHAWQELVRRNVMELAEAMKIDIDNLQWYAVFHNTTHHPHMHLLVYSRDGKQGWLTKQGIDKLRSTFGNDIFRNEQYMLFRMQTHQRDLLKARVDELLEEVADGRKWHPELQLLLPQLAEALAKHKGKKSYGYLPKRTKALVDEIVRQLSADPQVAAIYREWYKVNCEKLSLYYEKKGEPIPLERNKEFCSLKNAVIRTAGLMMLEQCSRQPSTEVVAKALGRISASFCLMVQDSSQRHQSKLQSQIDSKLWEKIAEQKAAHGGEDGDTARVRRWL